MSDRGSFADELKAKRTKLGLSQKQLASRVGITTTTVSSIELGKTEPARGTRNKLRAFFEATEPITVDLPASTHPDLTTVDETPLVENDYSFSLIGTMKNGDLLLKNRRGQFFQATKL